MRGATYRSTTLGLIASLALLAGCSSDDVTSEQLGTATDAIIGGELDTTHQAVVTWRSSHGSCSGTIFHVTSGYAYVLTAAHCFGPGDQGLVLIGDDNLDPDAELSIVDTEMHPYYDPQTNWYDFGMLKCAGVQPNTPYIPLLDVDQDTLVVDDMLEHVGYGLTSHPDGNTNFRHHVTVPIEETNVQLFLYNQDNGGPCSGDSGGPALTTTPDGERVAGVTSFGDPECAIYGVSGRVSLVYNHWIAPYAGLPQSSSGSGGGGTGGGAAGGGGGAGDGDSWLAGSVQDDSFTGDVVSSCAMRDDNANDETPWAPWLLAAAGAALAISRRRQ